MSRFAFRRTPTSRGRTRRTMAVPTAVLATSALLLSACSSSTPTSASASSQGGSSSGGAKGAAVTDIVLWESHNGGPVGGAMSAMVSHFNASHKSVQVSINVTKASTKLFAAIAAGNAPVLAEISHYDGQYVKAGALLSWNSFIAGSKNISSTSMYPSVWKNGDVGGQHYRLEADAKLSEVFYNESLFTKAGITSAPTTWTQLASDAAKLKASGVTLPIGWKDSSAHILPAFMSNGGTLLKGSNSVGNAVAFDNSAGQQTFSYFRTLYSRGLLSFHHGTTLRADLASGSMAMIDGTSAGYRKVLNAVGGKFKVGAFVEPAGSTGHAANLVQGLGFVLPKGHSHTQDVAAASFVRWWFQPAQQVFWDEATGYAPETKAATAAIPASYLATHAGLSASITAISSPYTVPRPVSDSYSEVQASLDAEFLNAVTGTQTISQALQTLQSQGNGYMSGASKL